MSDRALSWIQDDELMEVTPKSIRLRKLHLDPHERKRAEKARTAGAAGDAQGIALFIVAKGAAGLSVRGYPTQDGARAAELTLKDTPTIVVPSGVAGLRFRDEAETVNALVPQLQKQGVEAIVLLIHEGGYPTGGYNECPGISGPIVDIVDKLDPAVGVVQWYGIVAEGAVKIGGRTVRGVKPVLQRDGSGFYVSPTSLADKSVSSTTTGFLPSGTYSGSYKSCSSK